MNPKMVHFAFVLLLAVLLPFAASLKCYTCHSLHDRNNECAMLKNMEPTECSTQIATSVSKEAFPPEIKNIFDMDQTHNMPNPEWSCAKLEIVGMNTGNGPRSNYTIRTCQMANTGRTNFCEGATNKLKDPNNANNARFMMQHCSECKKDACNGAPSMSISLPLLGIFILASYFKA